MARVFPKLMQALLRSLAVRREGIASRATDGLVLRRQPVPLPLTALFALLCIDIFMAGLHRQQLSQQSELLGQLSARSITIGKLKSEIEKLSSSTEFTSQLPRSIDANQVMTRIQRAAATHGVSLTQLNVETDNSLRNQDSGSLRVLAWKAELHGNYASIKAMLADLLLQVPELRIGRLQMKRNGTELDASVSLLAWYFSHPIASATDLSR